MANDENIIPYQFTSSQSREAAARNGRRGGIASGVSKRAKKEAREVAKMVLSFQPDLPPQMAETLQRMGMKKNLKPDMRLVSTIAIMTKAMKGDVGAYKFVAEMAGETAEGAMANARAEETEMRNSDAGAEQIQPAMTGDGIRQRMAQMTDEELAQYERMCALFEDTGGDAES